ncbi:hypothetical protein DITRI_Ditri20bG0105000 [Diplodiscus trichospermus]
MFGRSRTKKLASLRAPSPPGDRKKNEIGEEWDKHALIAAIATAAAAEAVVAAAKVAVQVARLTGKESFVGIEEDSEALGNHPRLGSETKSNDYSKMLTINCKCPI